MLIIGVARAGASSAKKVRGFYRTAWSSHFGQSRNDTGNIISCHAPSILVLVQIPNSTRPKWTHACPKILTRRLLSDVHCFRLRRVSVSLLDFTPAPGWFPAENTLRASSDWGSTLIKILFNVSPTFQLLPNFTIFGKALFLSVSGLRYVQLATPGDD